jgi:hypothetical protein
LKRRVLRFGVIIGVATVSAFATAPTFAATNDTGGADSSASTGTGLFNLLDTDACTSSAPSGTGTGRCGDGLNLNNQIAAFDQNASGATNGTSSADASVAPIDITNLGTSLDLTGVLDGVFDIDSGTVLDDVINGLNAGPLKTLLQQIENQLVAPIDDALQDALAAVTEALPLGLQVGAVESSCTATAEPKQATGTSHVAGLDLLVHLGNEVIHVPIELGTSPNSNLLVDAPQQLVDGLILGITDTLTDSLGGSLSGINVLLSGAVQPIVDQLLDQLEPSLLQPLSDALQSIVAGTVNKQVPVSPSATGEIEVTALELKLFGDNVLDLGRSHCGPNSRGTGTPSNPGNPNNPDLPNVPTVVDSGMAGHADHTARNVLGATAALMLLAGTAGLMGYRRKLLK